MKKSILLVFLSIAILISKDASTDTIKKALQSGNLSGEVKIWYQTNDREPHDIFEEENSLFDAGLRLSYQTLQWHGFKAKASFYAVDDLGAYRRFADKSIHRSDPHETMTWLGEMYLSYSWQNTSLKFGRQNFKNPLVNSDTWAVFPNNFEGILFKNSSLSKTTFVAGWFTEERRLKKENFADFLGDDGVYFVGFKSKLWSPLTISAYYYKADLDGETYFWQGRPYRGYLNAAYLETKAKIKHFGLAVQYFFYNPQKSGYKTTKALAVKAEAQIFENLGLSLAFSTISDGYFNAAKLADNGIKTPLYTATISGDGDVSGRPDTDSFKIALTYKPIKGFITTLSYAAYNCDQKWNTVVSDDNLATSTELVLKYTGLKNFVFFLALVRSDHHGIGAWKGADDEELNTIRAWIRFTF